ncbi:MAG: hypothetical protein US62_C0045G0013, partial [Candidatus Woesebacteria bacterium GW2011_GWA1_37_8]
DAVRVAEDLQYIDTFVKDPTRTILSLLLKFNKLTL